MTLPPHHTGDQACPLCEAKLDQSDSFLADWYRKKVKMRWSDAHVSWSYRNETDQNQCVAEGKSKLLYPLSAHNYTDPTTGKPMARALDLFQIQAGGHAIWSPSFFAAINAMNEDEALPIKWGGSFKTLGDFDHYEIDTISST